MRFFTLILGLITLYLVSSCRNDFEFEPSTEALNFSKSIVYLDTVFTNIGSSTYTLKVYNPSDKNILIDKIKFERGQNTKFRMTVDGMTGINNREFDKVEMLAKDSMYIFIEVTSDVADANPLDFLYEDKIEFYHFGGIPKQTVDVVTLIQDAIFIKPNRTLDPVTNRLIKETISLNNLSTDMRGYELTDAELNWTNTKPYVVYDWVKVPNGKTLNIATGTRVHFHKNSGMIVDKFGTLKINGALSTYDAEGQIVNDNYVQFLGDRLEPLYANVPGQWGAIILFSNQNNEINYLKLKNAGVGIYTRFLDITNDFYQAKVTIKNSEIYNCSQIGIYGFNGDINASNTVINNCGAYAFAGIYGGKYNFTHCTLHNSWNSPNQFSVYLNNGLRSTEGFIGNDLSEANFNNCMIYGNNRIQFYAEKLPTNSPQLLNFKLNHCLIKFNANNVNLPIPALFNFNDPALYNNCTIADNNTNFRPKFKLTKNHPFDLTEAYTIPNDNAFSTGKMATDILGRPRNGQITVGAYQF